MIKCGIFIDGFNLYHSLRDAVTYTKYQNVKWLDIASLCNYFIKQPARSFLTESLSCECIHFYSAKPMHAYPQTRKKFDLYMDCLRKTGIEVHLGTYRRRITTCKLCKGKYPYHEEKETDVAIGVGILQKTIENDLGAVIVISGDSDLIPAYTALKELRPSTIRIAAMPYKRSLKIVKCSVDHYFNIKPKDYSAHQFDDPLLFDDGTMVNKPPTW